MDKALLSALRPKKPEKVQEGFSAILYGDPKSGKTTTLDDPNMKVLLLDLEGGTSVLAGAKNVDIVKIDSLEQLNAYSGLLERNSWINAEGNIVPLEHGLVAIDSITRLQDLVKDFVVEKLVPNRKREVEGRFGAQSDWGDFGQIIKDLVKYFHGLTKRGEKSINVMWIAHRDDRKDDISKSVVNTMIKMQGGSVSEVMSVVDALFYMAKRVDKDSVKYGIITNRMGIYEAGVRQSKRDERLPDVIQNPVWSDIFKKLGYKTN